MYNNAYDIGFNHTDGKAEFWVKPGRPRNLQVKWIVDPYCLPTENHHDMSHKTLQWYTLTSTIRGKLHKKII